MKIGNKFLIMIVMVFCISLQANQKYLKCISNSGMTVSWYYENDRIFIEMIAPTNGWVTIGFNSTSNIQGNYLLMGHVINGKPNVVEHYTISAGNYKPITTLGVGKTVSDIKGSEMEKKTSLSFSLPVEPNSLYQKNLNSGNELTLLIAYSREDDFKHHSMMRTSIKVEL